MVLYKKVFLLATDISFFQYITALRKTYFPNFVLTIDKLSSTENYRVQIFFTAPYWRWGWHNGYFERVFLKECMIQYSEGERQFTLQASAKPGNLLIASFQVLFGILVLGLAIFMMATDGGMSLNNIFGFATIMIFMLAPLVSIYLRDKKLLDKVGSLGRETEVIQNIT
jgi:hypothetical protein